MRKRLSDDTTPELALWAGGQNPPPNQPQQNGMQKKDGIPRRRKPLKTHCIKGHEFTPENTGIRRRGSSTIRHCRTCDRNRCREYNRRPEIIEKNRKRSLLFYRNNRETKIRENAAFKRKHPERVSKYGRKYYEKHRERLELKRQTYRNENLEKIRLKARNRFIWHQYGLTIEEYAHMLNNQDRKCAICGEGPMVRPHIDHNHATGRVREIVCPKCNQALGFIERDEGIWLDKALAYLKKHSA